MGELKFFSAEMHSWGTRKAIKIVVTPGGPRLACPPWGYPAIPASAGSGTAPLPREIAIE